MSAMYFRRRESQSSKIDCAKDLGCVGVNDREKTLHSDGFTDVLVYVRVQISPDGNVRYVLPPWMSRIL